MIDRRHLVHLLGHGFKFLFHGHARTHLGSLDGMGLCLDLCLSLGFRDELGKACGRFQARMNLALIPKMMATCQGKQEWMKNTS